MIKVAVMIDRWKLEIFKKHLDKAGFKYKKHPGLTHDTINLKVDAETIEELHPIILAANQEAARSKMN